MERNSYTARTIDNWINVAEERLAICQRQELELGKLSEHIAELEAFIVRIVDPVSLNSEDARFVSLILEPEQGRNDPPPF